MPGITIGNNSIIGAGSIVTHDVEEGSVVAGNPARKLKNYYDFINENKEHMKSNPCYGEDYTLRNPAFTEVQKQEQKEAVEENKFGYVR